MADAAPNAGGGGGAAPAPDYTPEEAAKCVKFVRAILREYGTSAADVQDVITDMDYLGEHYAVRFAEKMKEIDEVEWGIVYDEEATRPTPPSDRGTQGKPKPTLVYEVIMPRTTPPTVRLVGTFANLRLAFSYVSERLGTGEIPVFKASDGGPLARRYGFMLNKVRAKGEVFFSEGQGLEFMVIPDAAKHLYVEGVHHVVV